MCSVLCLLCDDETFHLDAVLVVSNLTQLCFVHFRLKLIPCVSPGTSLQMLQISTGMPAAAIQEVQLQEGGDQQEEGVYQWATNLFPAISVRNRSRAPRTETVTCRYTRDNSHFTVNCVGEVLMTEVTTQLI